MPSPFPGMNPNLEQPDVWQDFHDRFVPALGDALAALVSPNFIVKIEEHVHVYDPRDSGEEYLGNADVAVASSGMGAENGNGGSVLTSPVMVRVPVAELEKQPYLEVVDGQDRVVAIIEVLSPANKKPGPFRRQFIYKRSQILASWASYVEIDLLRGGERMPLEPPPASDNYVLVNRYEDRPEVNRWPIRLRDTLPPIPIPLPTPLGSITMDFQSILHTVYDRAYYKDRIYRGKPSPPLSPEDAAWAASLVPAKS